MKSFSVMEARQRFAAVLDAAQEEAVVIQRKNCDIAVVLSLAEYNRLRDLNSSEFQRFCDRVASQATAQGMNEAVLNRLLLDNTPESC